MTNNKIIYKAVLKAQKNGYNDFDIKYFLDNNLYEMIIFDIDFAKAFFGERNLYLCRTLMNSGWEYHLQQMVILEENERIKYLKGFL